MGERSEELSNRPARLESFVTGNNCGRYVYRYSCTYMKLKGRIAHVRIYVY